MKILLLLASLLLLLVSLLHLLASFLPLLQLQQTPLLDHCLLWSWPPLYLPPLPSPPSTCSSLLRHSGECP